MSECKLSVDRINVTLGTGKASVCALSNVSLAFSAGVVTLIMGPSGSGKTTLLSVLGCLLKPSDGTVLLNGKDVTTSTEDELAVIRRDHIGFVFQSFRLFNSLNALENVMLAMEICDKRSKDIRSRAESLLKDLGMLEKKHLKPDDLSGGEKQRVAIARALMRDPEFLLADEPTASLDSQTGERVARILQEVAERQNRTVIVVSHDERLRTFAKHLVVLRDGQVIEQLN